MHSMLMTAALLAVLAASSVAGETPGPESFLPSVGDKDAYTPAAGWGKDSFLVVWRSGHLSDIDMARQSLKFDVQLVGCRVSRTGQALDAKPFVISSASDLRERPRLAFGGGVFLAVWQDLRNGKDWDVYAARVSAEGKVLDPDGILAGGGVYNQALPEVAWDGKAFQVVWQDWRSGKRYEVFGARVSADGKVLDAQPVQLASGKAADEQFFGPAVAAAPEGGRSLLFWLGKHLNRGNPLASCQFVIDGKTSGAPTFVETDYHKGPGGQNPTFPAFLAAGPREYLLTWNTNSAVGRGQAPSDFNAAVFNSEGKMKKMLLMTEKDSMKNPGRIRNPQAAWDGKGFVAAWDEWGAAYGGHTTPEGRVREEVFAARVSAEGECPPSFHVAGEGKNPKGDGNSPAIKPTVASDGAGVTLIAYEQHPATGDVPIKIGFRMLTK